VGFYKCVPFFRGSLLLHFVQLSGLFNVIDHHF
jgi:hypothetical protein